VPIKGVCQICGCTENDPCFLLTRRFSTCAWIDETKTLCTNPNCVSAYWRSIQILFSIAEGHTERPVLRGASS